MDPVEVSADPTVQQIIRDLQRRAELAEARADSETYRADSETYRAEKAEEKNAADEKIITALMAEIGSLTRALARASSRPEQLALKLKLRAVQRRVDDLCRDKFGQRSERRGRKGAKAKKAPKKQTGHGPNPQVNLPRDPQLHLLDAPDQICPKCTPPRPLEPWEGKTEDSEEITVIERTFRVTLHKKQIYRCGGCGHLETALGPKRLIAGGRYSPEFAATVASDKYRDHLPLNRQATRMGEAGLVVTRQTLWDQIELLYVLLLPIYLALQDKILQSEVVFADETSWRYMQKGKTRKWWVWGATDGTRVFFLLAATRGAAAARELLRDFSGILMADRYTVYQALEKERSKRGGKQLVMLRGNEETIELPTPDYMLVVCWMHARRGFIKASNHGEEKADEVLDLIAGLYAVEAEATAKVAEIEDDEERQSALLVTRARLRQEQSRPIIDELKGWLESTLAIPELPLSDAINWMKNGWKQLIRFLDDPRIPLDNGSMERAIRGIVLGRKTHAGSRSRDGTQVAALFYSLVESCRFAGVDAREYMIEAARRALLDRDSVFLPEDFAKMTQDPVVPEGDLRA